MLVTMTLDFDLPREADIFAAVCEALNSRAPDVAVPEPVAAPPAPEAAGAPRKRGRPAKTAVVPLPDALAPAAEQPEPAAQSVDLFGENTRHYVEPAPTLDDVKAALQVYFAKDRAGAIALVQSYGVQQFAHIPPEKFVEFIAKCKAASA